MTKARLIKEARKFMSRVNAEFGHDCYAEVTIRNGEDVSVNIGCVKCDMSLNGMIVYTTSASHIAFEVFNEWSPEKKCAKKREYYLHFSKPIGK